MTLDLNLLSGFLEKLTADKVLAEKFKNLFLKYSFEFKENTNDTIFKTNDKILISLQFFDDNTLSITLSTSKFRDLSDEYGIRNEPNIRELTKRIRFFNDSVEIFCDNISKFIFKYPPVVIIVRGLMFGLNIMLKESDLVVLHNTLLTILERWDEHE